jgi:hypothetical protein
VEPVFQNYAESGCSMPVAIAISGPHSADRKSPSVAIFRPSNAYQTRPDSHFENLAAYYLLLATIKSDILSYTQIEVLVLVKVCLQSSARLCVILNRLFEHFAFRLTA